MKIKISDYVADFIAGLGVSQVFLISGGGDMHLVDSIGTNKKLKYICMHHEQALAMAAEAWARVRQHISVVVVTSGPSGTNAITGVAGAWLDSAPMLVLSGQVKTSNLIPPASGLRQYGVQELPIVDLVRPITKYAKVVMKPEDIAFELEKAVQIATTPRFGPVWLDIPLDVQGAIVEKKSLSSSFWQVPMNHRDASRINKINDDSGQARLADASAKRARVTNNYVYYKSSSHPFQLSNNQKQTIKSILTLLSHSHRPVIYAGQGIRLSGAHKDFLKLIEKLNIPVFTAWNGNDLIDSNHSLYMGRPGSFGMRHSNIILQKSDFFLSVGARLSVPQLGYNFDDFAPSATKIVVDIDPAELKKPSLKSFKYKINADAGEFIRQMLKLIIEENTNLKNKKAFFLGVESGGPPTGAVKARLGGRTRQATKKNGFDKPINSWLDFCNNVKQKYPVVLPEYKKLKKYVNSYYFIDMLSDSLSKDDVIITDMGTSFTCTAQTFKVKLGQRYFTSSGLASMGFGLPGAIGAAFAHNKRTICISGDGGLMMNIQEFQTLAHYKLNLKLFVINNASYLTIRETQRNFFKGRFIASTPGSGVSCPDICRVADSYGLKTFKIGSQKNIKQKIGQVLKTKGPVVCEIVMDPHQQLIPKLVSTMDKKGNFQSPSLENMYPFLPEKVLKKIMS